MLQCHKKGKIYILKGTLHIDNNNTALFQNAGICTTIMGTLKKRGTNMYLEKGDAYFTTGNIGSKKMNLSSGLLYVGGDANVGNLATSLMPKSMFKAICSTKPGYTDRRLHS